MVKLQKQTYFLTLIMIIIFGTNLIFTKQVLPPLSSVSYIFMRYLISTGVLLGYLVYTGKIKDFLIFLRHNIKEMALLGMLLNAGALILVFYGLKYTSSTNSFLIQNFTLFIVIILNKIINKKNPSKITIFSSIIILAGLIFVIYPLNFSGNQNSFGDLLTLASTIFAALTKIFNKRFCEKHNTLFITTGYSVTISIATLPMVFILGEFHLYFTLTHIQWGSLIYLAIMLSSIGYFMNYKIASDPHITPEMMSLISVLITIMGVFSGVIFLDETMNIINIVGAICVFIGVYFGTISTMPSTTKENVNKNEK